MCVEVSGITLAKQQEDDSRRFATDAAKIALERHCTDVVVLDLRGLSPAADYFVIATGTSDRQRRTVIDEVSENAKKAGLQRFGKAGYDQGRWILVDFVDVVVHVFDEEYRTYYDLEMLWGDAKRVRIR
jgi:ribosome-associated protein